MTVGEAGLANVRHRVAVSGKSILRQHLMFRNWTANWSHRLRVRSAARAGCGLGMCPRRARSGLFSSLNRPIQMRPVGSKRDLSLGGEQTRAIRGRPSIFFEKARRFFLWAATNHPEELQFRLSGRNLDARTQPAVWFVGPPFDYMAGCLCAPLSRIPERSVDCPAVPFAESVQQSETPGHPHVITKQAGSASVFDRKPAGPLADTIVEKLPCRGLSCCF